MNLEEELREALHQEAASVEVDDDEAVARHRRLVARSNRRRPVAIGAVAAAAAAVVVAFVVGRDGDEPTEGVVVDAPSTTSVATTTSTTPTTTSPPGVFPATAIAAFRDGRLAVIDTATGEAIRVLATYDDLDEAPPEEGGPWYVIQVAPTADGTSAYVESCCEPAGGHIVRYDLGTGGEPVPFASGYAPTPGPDGTVAVAHYNHGIGIHGRSAEPTIAQGEQFAVGDWYFVGTAWLDGDTLAYVVSDWSGDQHRARAQIWRHELADATLEEDTLLVETREIAGIVTRGDGMLVWAGTDGVAHVVDPASGEEAATFDLGGPVVDLAYDATGTWLLAVLEDGGLRWFGAGESGVIPGSYTAAGW